MIVMLILGILETVPKSFAKQLIELEIQERIKTIQIRALLNTAKF